MLNKIYGLVQAGRCLFSIIDDDKFEQPEVDRHVFRKFDDGKKVEMVVFVDMDNILADAQVSMEGSAAELGRKV